MDYSLGEFEELVLLNISNIREEAYGINIKTSFEENCGRKVSLGSLRTALIRLEKKGYLSSYLGEAVNKRGGKRKRFYEVTALGYRVLSHVREIRTSLWNSIPEFSINISR